MALRWQIRKLPLTMTAIAEREGPLRMSVLDPTEAAERFVEKWSASELSERAASHEHFIDLCRLIGQPAPAEADPTGTDYCFEKAVKVTQAASKGSKGESGFVDVWKTRLLRLGIQAERQVQDPRRGLSPALPVSRCAG